MLAAGLAVLVIAAPASAGTEYGKDWEHCVQIVANLRAEQPDVPCVVLLGGSSARECTVDDESWASQVERRSGYDVLTYNLGSKHRTYAQDLELVKRLPAGQTLVYIGVNLGRFCLAPTSATIRLPSSRSVSRYFQHRYSCDRIQTLATKRSYVAYWMDQRWPNFQSHYDGELAVLQEIIRVCRRRRLRVALLDLPRDLPAIGSALDEPVSTYHDGCSRLARRWNVPWLHFVGSCDLADSDFFDIFHLVEPGRVKFQSALSDATIRLLTKYRMTGTNKASVAIPSALTLALDLASASSDPGSAATSVGSSSLSRSLVLGVACLLAIAGAGARIWRG